MAAPAVFKFMSAFDFHTLYKTSRTTPLEVIENILAFIHAETTGDARNKLGNMVFTQVYDSRVLEMAKGSSERWKCGEILGFLDGVPFGECLFFWVPCKYLMAELNS